MIKAIIILSLLVTVNSELFSQFFHAKTYTERNGLPSSRVFDVQQRKDARMVFATRKGLGIFDAYEWRNIDAGIGSGKSTIRLRKDSNDEIWGLLDTDILKIYRLDGDSAVFVPEYSAFSGKSPFFIDFDIIHDDNKIYLAANGSNAGVLLFDGDDWQELSFTENATGNIRTYAVQRVGKRFFAATEIGLFSFDLNGKITDYPDLGKTKVTSLYSDDNATLYLTTFEAIYKYSDGEFQKLLNIHPIIERTYDARHILLPDFEGIYIYGVGANVFFEDTRRNISSKINENFGALANGATSVFKDRENNIWVTNLRGISKFVAFSVLNIRSGGSLFEDEVTSITSLSDGTKVVANPERFLIIRDNKIIKKTAEIDNPENKYFRILDLETDSEDRVWYAAEKMGFGYLDNNFNIQKITIPGEENILAYSVLSVGKDSLYFLIRNKLFLKNKNRFVEIPVEQDTANPPSFRKLFHSNSQYPAIGTMHSGVFIYDVEEGRYKNYYSRNIDDSRNIYSVYFDGDVIYAGSSNELYTLDADSLKPKKLGDHYLERPVYFIGKDLTGNFWLGTDNGVYKWNNVRLVIYSVDDGISGLETNRDGFYCDKNGDVWIGTSQGLSIVNQKLDSINQAIPNLVIDRLETSLRTIYYKPGIILKPEENGFFVHLKNISYVNEDEISYAVNLEGLDDSWYDVYQEETVPYAPFFDLVPGEYKLNVRMYIGYNDLVASTSSSTIIVKSPVWDTFEFKLLLMFAVLCVILLIVLYHRKNLYTGKLEKEVDRRTEEIKYSEVRDQVIFANNKNVMLFVEPFSFKVVEVNKAATSYYGYSEHEFQTLTLNDLELKNIGDDDPNEFEFPSNSGSYERIHKKKSGELREVEVIYSILPYLQGQLYFLIITDITERKRAEAAIKESEEKYRSLISNIQDGIILIQDSKISFVNQALADILGYDKKEIINRKFIDFVHDDDKKFVVENYLKRLDGEGTFDQYEIGLWSKDRQKVYVSVHVGVFRFEKRLAVMATIKNMTEKRKSEERLRILSTVVEQSPVCIILTDSEFNITYVNPVFSSATGFLSSEITGKPIDILRLYDTGIKERIRHSLSMGETWVGELKNKRKNGAIYWASVIISPIKDEHGKTSSYVSLETDISFEKYALEEIKKNEKLLNSVLDNLPVILFVADVRGIFTIHRGGALINNSTQRSSMVGKSVFDVYKEQPDILEDINRAFKGEWFTSVRSVGEKIFETHYSTLTDGFGKSVGVIGVNYDVTEREQAKGEIISAKEEAEKSDRLKSEFLAQVSHEIRTPINSIMSFASLIKEEVGEQISEDTKYGFQVIEKGGLRLIRTIDLILNMSQMQTQTYTPKIERFKLIPDVFDTLLPEMKHIAAINDLELRFENNSVRDDVLGDKYTIFQIFNNLVDNAIKYTHKGYITIRLYEADTLLCVDVEDTGIGMSQEFIKDIFLPFSQEETGYTRKYEGNGLGMALVKEYAKLNNAELEIVSEKGKGTKITVKFAI